MSTSSSQSAFTTVNLHFSRPFGSAPGPSSAAGPVAPQQVLNNAALPRAASGTQQRTEPSGTLSNVLHICAMPEVAHLSTEEIRWAHKSGQPISSQLNFKATADPESAGTSQCLHIQNVCTMRGLNNLSPEELRWHDKLAQASGSTTGPLYRPTSTPPSDDVAVVSMTPESVVAATPAPFGSPAPVANPSTPATDATPTMPVRNLFPSPQASTPTPLVGSPLNPAGSLVRAQSSAAGDSGEDPTPSDRVCSYEEARWFDRCCTTGSQLMVQAASGSPGRDGGRVMHCDITAMPKYAHLSVEELRWQERTLSAVPDWFRRATGGQAARAAAAMLAAGQEEDDAAVPADLKCPITLSIMTDPVICLDGHTYERSAIEGWLAHKNTSPKTNMVLNDKRLVPNMAVKSMIEEWKQQRKQQQQQQQQKN